MSAPVDAVVTPSKEQMLRRFSNAIDMGLVTPERMRLMERWLDFVLRFEGGQMSDVARFLWEENRRKSLYGPKDASTLASDADGYALNRLAAILTHHCQRCAEDPNAWHTRSAFCEHRSV